LKYEVRFAEEKRNRNATAILELMKATFDWRYHRAETDDTVFIFFFKGDAKLK
jgi:hypothetical protein